MSPILVQWGNWSISVYAACLSLGLFLALMVVGLEARACHIRSAVWLDAALAALTLGVVAARLGYAALNWTYFQQHPLEILEVWEGGLSWHAGLIGGSIGAWLIAHRLSDRRPIELLDTFALALPIGLAFGWLGSYFSAAAYGRELYPGDAFFWLAVDQPDLYGLVNPRWPTQLMGAAWSGLLAVGLLLTRRYSARRHDWPAGTRFWLCLAVYSLGAFAIGFTRADDVPLLGGWRVDQLFDAVLVIAGLSQLLRGSISARRKDAHGRLPAA
ncbi:Phosphatidylglycerol--prolipoprotein diacylglyceryl transferase [Anaerolineae bacterium]|nr:Phosphatidylglycerol--prolipoprotein diacylglyceryl transferase [Anaerolineae bacterium]